MPLFSLAPCFVSLSALLINQITCNHIPPKECRKQKKSNTVQWITQKGNYRWHNTGWINRANIWQNSDRSFGQSGFVPKVCHSTPCHPNTSHTNTIHLKKKKKHLTMQLSDTEANAAQLLKRGRVRHVYFFCTLGRELWPFFTHREQKLNKVTSSLISQFFLFYFKDCQVRPLHSECDWVLLRFCSQKLSQTTALNVALWPPFSTFSVTS